MPSIRKYEIKFMNNYLKPNMDGDLHSMSVLGLAYVGDAVFELMIRTWLSTSHGTSTAKNLHIETVSYVSAKAQAVSAEKIVPLLNEEEYAVFKRGRNAHVNNVPRGSTYEEYHNATGIEALFGYLYLRGETARLNELFEMILEEK